MSADFSKEIPAEVVFVADAAVSKSSIEQPIEEWSSLLLEVPDKNIKKVLFTEGLYHPGSGEICTKYIPMSDSAVFVHPYFKYPAIHDPGITKALFDPPDVVTYPDDGQELYTALCEEMNQCPVRIFQRGLLEEVIDLKYYCVNPAGIRAMATALHYNRFVKVLDLTDNFLSDDACYHIGQMLIKNAYLKELNLSGCRIGPTGVLRLSAGLVINRCLEVLNLNKNQLGDSGIEYLAQVVFSGIYIKKMYLQKNNIGSKGAAALAEAFETNNNFVVIDLSWNNLFSPAGLFNLLSILSENKLLEELYLSWNGLAGERIGLGIKKAMTAPKLQYLDLSNNKFSGVAIRKLIDSMPKAQKLRTLDLSYNPITPMDALNILTKMMLPTVKLKQLIMENVYVDEEFLGLLQAFKDMKSKKDTVVKYGGVKTTFNAKGTDVRELLLNRADYLSSKRKKATSNLALVVLQLGKDKVDIMDGKLFYRALISANVPLDVDLVDQIVNAFPGPRGEKGAKINISLLLDYIKRKWPNQKLPPTPPPEPEPMPVKGKKGGVKGGKKK